MRLLLLALAGLGLLIQDAAACSCRPSSREEIIADANLVVKGRVASVHEAQTDGLPGVCAKIRVHRTIKGPRRKWWTICSAGSSSLCGVSFTRGEIREWAAYGAPNKPGSLTTGSCSSL